MINAQTLLDVRMVDPDGDNAGTWYCEFDTSSYDGNIEIAAKGRDTVTRYAVWSSFITLEMNTDNIPDVTILNPIDQSTVGNNVQIEVSAEARNNLRKVEVRINSGPWLQAKRDGSTYKYRLDTTTINRQNPSFSIEARATDENGNVGRSMTTYARTKNSAVEPVVVEPQDRAMWIWEAASYNLFLNRGSRDVLDALAKDTSTFQSDAVTTFYLGIDHYYGMNIMEEEPDKVRDFVAWAHANGYKVHACIAGGTILPYMGAYERYHEAAVRRMEEVINYNLASAPNERFDGINVDIEPYIMPAFKTDKPSLQIEYLDGLQKMIQRRDAAGINLPFGTVIPKWYDTSDSASNIPWNGSTKWMSEHIQDISDYIGIMDYRDTADGTAGIIQGAVGELAYANQIGKPQSVVVGVETLDIANGGDPETITFREEGRTHMENELDKVYAAFNNDPAFAGIAMHHYDSVRYLPSDWSPDRITWEPPADDTPPSAVSSDPVATAFDYQRIDIQFDRAYDNTEVEEYYIYRSTTNNFTPGPTNLAGKTRALLFRDTGLLPNTTYYYKVAAVDVRGNIGPASDVTGATTDDTSLQPLIISTMDVTHTGTNAKVTLKVVDKETNQPLVAAVHGRFTYAAGRYIYGNTTADGLMSATSEAVASNLQVGFEPRGVTKDGYYWAKAYDFSEPITVNVQLNLLKLNLGELQPAFSPETTNYTATVAHDVTSITLTATADKKSSISFNRKHSKKGKNSRKVSLKEGENRVRVYVTSPDGTSKEYTITIIRSAPKPPISAENPNPDNPQPPGEPLPDNPQQPDGPQPDNPQQPDGPQPDNPQQPDEPQPDNPQQSDEPQPDNPQQPDGPTP